MQIIPYHQALYIDINSDSSPKGNNIKTVDFLTILHGNQDLLVDENHNFLLCPFFTTPCDRGSNKEKTNNDWQESIKGEVASRMFRYTNTFLTKDDLAARHTRERTGNGMHSLQ